MRTVIFGSGAPCKRAAEYIRPGDYIICADGGYDRAKALGIRPDLLLGDFDSISEVPDNVEIERYPTRKDFTDSEIALCAAKSADAEDNEILMFGFTGDRADHTLNNIMLLTRYKNAVIIDDNNEIRLLSDCVRINGRIGQTISIIPVCGDLEGVVTDGLEYPLNGDTLHIGESRGVSNVMTSDTAVIRCRSGMGFVIKVEKV